MEADILLIPDWSLFLICSIHLVKAICFTLSSWRMLIFSLEYLEEGDILPRVPDEIWRHRVPDGELYFT